MTAWWLRADIMRHYPRAVEAASDAGFLLALYGSAVSAPVINGPGIARDLDLIAVPKRHGVEWSILVNSLCGLCGWKEATDPTVSGMGAVCVQFLTLDNTVVDLQIRGVPLRSLDPRAMRNAEFTV